MDRQGINDELHQSCQKNSKQYVEDSYKLFFCNRETYILLGGEITKKILLEQGVPQDDVVLPYVFIVYISCWVVTNQDKQHKANTRD